MKLFRKPDPVEAARQPWYRKPLCWTGNCGTFRPQSDDDGVWGECDICGQRAGYVTRQQLRAYADAEYEARQCLDEMVAANRAAPATREYARRRAAAKKGIEHG